MLTYKYEVKAKIRERNANLQNIGANDVYCTEFAWKTCWLPSYIDFWKRLKEDVFFVSTGIISQVVSAMWVKLLLSIFQNQYYAIDCDGLLFFSQINLVIFEDDLKIFINISIANACIRWGFITVSFMYVSPTYL